MRGKNNPMYGKKRPEHSKKMSGSGNQMFGKKNPGAAKWWKEYWAKRRQENGKDS